MSNFDPWESTFEQARDQPNSHELHGAVFQWVMADKLKKESQKILSHGFGVLEAVAVCARYGLVMPDWLADAYLTRYLAVEQCKVGSWDAEAAFGRPYLKGKQMPGLRRSMKNRVLIARAVADEIARNPHIVIDVRFWEEIGHRFGEGKTSAQKLHAEAVQNGYAVSPTKQKKVMLGK